MRLRTKCDTLFGAEALRMNVSDLTNLVVGLALIYFGWQQNQIFKRQNEIFATQAGIEMPPPRKSRMAVVLQYWPLLAMVALAVAMWLAAAYDRMVTHSPIGAATIAVPWALVAVLLVTVVYSRKSHDEASDYEPIKEQHRKHLERIYSGHEKETQQADGKILTLQRELEALRNRPVKKLTIHSARWVVKGDEQYNHNAAPSLDAQIKESVIEGISVLLTNENLGGVDPKEDTHKLLRLTYSYGENGTPQKIVKYEGERLTLPELPDSRISGLEIDLSKKTTEVDNCATLLGMERAEVNSLRDEVKAIANAKRTGWPYLTVERESVDLPTTDPTITHKNKLRIVVRNDSGKEIQVWAPLWDESSEVKCSWPFGAKLRLAGPKGWVSNDWQEEQYCLAVAPQAHFQCWIGLMPPSGDSIERRAPQQRNGVLIFPIKVENTLLEACVKV